MKKTLVTILTIILVFSISAFGSACKNETPAEESSGETAVAPAGDEIKQSQGSVEDESIVESSDEADNAVEEEASGETAGEEAEMIVYSIDSKMEDLLDNPLTMEVLEKYIPDVVNSDRIDESRNYMLRLVLQFSDIEEDIIPLLDEALKNVVSESTTEAVMEVNYNIKFEATWSSSSHPDDYVSNAHFSPFIVYSYNGTDQGRILNIGSISSPGIEEMAETGATGILIEEINQTIEENNALRYVKAVSFNSPGQTEAMLNFSQEFSQFIFVSMIAPSPDWFVSEEADLFIEGQWVDQIVLDVISFDSGTDSGESLTSANSDTDPKEPISRFDDYLQKLGIITVTKI